MPVVHKFVEEAEEALSERGEKKGALCARIGKRPAWYSVTMNKIVRGKASQADIVALADALAFFGPRTPEADRLIVLACRGE